MFNSVAFERIGKFFMPKQIELNEEIYNIALNEEEREAKKEKRLSSVNDIQDTKCNP